MREREEADEAHHIAKKERAEADAAKYKYYSKLALQFGRRWKALAKQRGKARRKEERRLRKKLITAAPPTPSVVTKMVEHVGAECYRWESELHHGEDTAAPGVAERARKLQGLRKDYLAGMAKEQKRQRAAPGSMTLPRVGRRTGVVGGAMMAGSMASSGGARTRTLPGSFGGFGANASSFVPTPPAGKYDGGGGSSSDRPHNRRSSAAARRRKADGSTEWAVRGASGTLSSARDSARNAVKFTSKFDGKTLHKVVEFSAVTKATIKLPTAKPVPPHPRLSGGVGGLVGRAELPRPPPTPGRLLQAGSLRDAALLNAYERAERQRPPPTF